MKIIIKFGLFLVLFILISGFVSAEEVTDVDTASEDIWNGTWNSAKYTVYISQDGAEIAGACVPMDFNEYDPGMLEGNISSDGKTYSGVWIETGGNSNTLSPDMMSFSISGYADPQGPMTEPANYTSNATRVGEIVDPANPWTGNYVSEWKTYNLTQDGTTLTEYKRAASGIDDNAGVINGTVSEDGMTYTGTWIEKGGFSFIMADDDMSIHATITKSLEPDAIEENLTFSK